MNKYKNIIDNDATKKEFVIQILKLLDSESYIDAKEILDIAAYFIKEHAYLDFDLAESSINSIIEEK